MGTALGLAATASAADPGVDEIMQRNFMVSKVVDSRAAVTMTLVNDRGQRRRRVTQTLTKLLPNGVDQKRLVRFTAPADVRGTATLMIEHAEGDDDIWIYLPVMRKVRRLVANNKKDSFVGTDFSYGDIIGHKVEDWTHRLVGSATVDGVATWVIESEPRSDDVRQTSGYGKRMLWVRIDNFVAIQGRFWDTGGTLLKELHATDVRPLVPADDKWQAFRLEMRNLQNGHRTEIVFERVDVGVGLSDAQFSERYLEKES